MAKLIYSAITSLDGYVADQDGNFDWAVPDAEVHAFINELERPVGTYLYGRRMYEVMLGWARPDRERAPLLRDYAELWQAADKVVFSESLPAVSTSRTRLERAFAPDGVRQMKAAATRDLSIGGPHLAAQAIKAGLVDEYHLSTIPIAIGAGHSPFAKLDEHLKLDVVEEQRFRSGALAQILVPRR